jgi:hypothetical protein
VVLKSETSKLRQKKKYKHGIITKAMIGVKQEGPY